MDLQANAITLASRTRRLGASDARAANRVIAAARRGWTFGMATVHFADRYEPEALDQAQASCQAAATLQLVCEEHRMARRLP